MDNILSKNAYFNVFWIICYPKEEIWGRIINLSNKRFGRLVVIERANDYISPKGRHKVQWWCQVCGHGGLGYYGNFEDAVKARKEAEEKYFGEYSYDNSMKE